MRKSSRLLARPSGRVGVPLWILGLACSAIPVISTSTIRTLYTGSHAIASVKWVRNIANLHSQPDDSKRHDCRLVSKYGKTFSITQFEFGF